MAADATTATTIFRFQFVPYWCRPARAEIPRHSLTIYLEASETNGPICVLAAAAACLLGPAQRPMLSTPPVTIHDLGHGVYAAILTEPLSLALNANSLFIVNDSGVVVVDAQFTRVATLANIAALRRITPKPVRYVINTHWHDDRIAGNQVYQDSFPGVRFLAHANTPADLIGLGRPNRGDQVRYAPAAADRYQRLLEAGLGLDSTAASPAEAAAVTSALGIIRQYVAEHSGYREVLPEGITGAGQTLVTEGRTIELRWFGRGNTRGDLVVYLPDQGIAATGDLLVAPIPLGFNSYPSEWIAVLDSIAALARLSWCPATAR